MRTAGASDEDEDAVAAVADGLYALPADEFTAARTTAADAARKGGDAATAKAIGALRKPNAVAATANELVRAHRAEVDDLVALGETMRSATAAFDAGRLRELSLRQRRLIAELVELARADADGRLADAAARGLEDTLHAALADPDAAEQLLAGRLTAGLTASGFPTLPASSTRNESPTHTKRNPTPKQSPRTSPTDRTAENRNAADRAQAEAAAASASADHAAAEAVAQLTHAEQTAAAAAASVDRLEAELADARAARTRADRGVAAARRAQQKAGSSAEKARAALEKAASARRRMG